MYPDSLQRASGLERAPDVTAFRNRTSTSMASSGCTLSGRVSYPASEPMPDTSSTTSRAHSTRANAVRPGALDPDLDAWTELRQPGRQASMAGRIHTERLDPEHAAVGIDRRCDVDIGEYVHTPEHSGHRRLGCPFLSLSVKGLRSPAQSVTSQSLMSQLPLPPWV
jgi:hypothetical protein